ncbi:MAG: sulfite exporter TauE/SafE family protein [Oscillospiraceae bacterium]|jgi:uncharacterized membrane protein YfcA|nr:sulfite exporter TauE/SafE family protein [Oscillospiraceae bacterium]
MVNVIIGFLSGVTASMGLGGGFVLIVYLTAFTDIGQREAGAINLMFFLPVALLSLILHFKNKLVDTKVIPVVAIFGVIGIATGFGLAYVLPEGYLRKVFAVFLLFAGANELFSKAEQAEQAE